MRTRSGGRIASTALVTVLVAGGCAYFSNSQSKLDEAAVHMEEGNTVEAEKLYREVMRSKGPDSNEARALLINLLINRGGDLMDAGKDDDAIPLYREALSLDRDRDESVIAYARALMKVERFTEAIDALMNAKGCRGCKTMVSVIYLERGLAGIRDGDYADALDDFDLALGMDRDPMTVLHKVSVYTEGGYGTGSDAVGYLDHALRLLPVDQAGVQQLWWDKRTQVIYTAALAHDTTAINQALQLSDPRSQVSAEQKKIDLLNLRMYAASLEIYANDFDAGIERGLRAYAAAEGSVPDEARTALRDTLMGLFMQRAAVHLAADEDGAARQALAQALELEPDNPTLNYQNIIAMAERSTSSARKLLSKWEGDPMHDRLRGLIELAYVRKMMGIGQFTAARAGLERAERYAPDLLDAKLVRAELEATTRFEGLKKRWFETYRELDTFSYPSNRINYYGRALAYLRAAQAGYDKAAQADYLRLPAFAARIQALEKTIKEFYPYEAELLGPDQAEQAVLVLEREEDGEVEVKVAGPKQEHVVKIKGGETKELPLGTPGLAVVNGPMGPKVVFGEPGVKIIVKI